MPAINGDVILEIVAYLNVLDSLSLAHSCSAAFQASRRYFFWSPHQIPSSEGLAAFLPDEHIGPWKSYTGDEIRLAIVKMRNLKNRWASQRVRATCRVPVGRFVELREIPSSKWLYSFRPSPTGSTMFTFVDGRTGVSTIKDLDITPSGTYNEEELPTPNPCLLEPNRILMGIPGRNVEDVWSFATFEIVLTVNDNDGSPFIEGKATQVQRWDRVTPNPDGHFIPRSEFLVLESPLWNVGIFHASSGRHWSWGEQNETTNMCFVYPWYIFFIGDKGAIELVAVHLPSLLSLPETSHGDVELPRGTIVPIEGEKFYWVDRVTLGPDTSEEDGIYEYTVILTESFGRFLFDIRIGVPEDGVYGCIAMPDTCTLLPTDSMLETELSSLCSAKTDNTIHLLEDGSPAPVEFTTLQLDYEVLVMGFHDGQHLSRRITKDSRQLNILRMSDIDKSSHSRILDWKAPLTRRIGSDKMGEIDYEGDPDDIFDVPRWNASTGMLVLSGPDLRREEDLREYQICWFT